MGARSKAFLACCALMLVPTWSQPSAAQGVSVDVATPEQKTKAQEFFADGMKQFDAKEYAKALESFQSSYGTVASPNTHLMIARSLRELDRLVEAYVAYEHVIKEAEANDDSRKKYAKSSEAARAELEDLRPRIALVTMQIKGATPDTKLVVGGREIPSDQWDQQIPVRVGVVAISASAPGKRDVRMEVEATGGTTTVDLDLNATWAPAPPPPPPKPVAAEASVSSSGMTTRHWAYVAGGVGAAGLVTFGVFGVLNNDKYGDLEDSCPDNQCPSNKSSDIDSGKSYQTIANIGLAVGVVGIGTGVALYLLSDDPNRAGRETSISTSPRVDVGLGNVSVSGQF